MTTSRRWRTVLASAAAIAALFAAPLVGAATAHAAGQPTTPQSAHAPNHADGSDEHGSDEDRSDEHGCDNSCDNGKPELAHTGDDHTQEVILGSAAAALIAAGAGTMLIARRRNS